MHMSSLLWAAFNDFAINLSPTYIQDSQFRCLWPNRITYFHGWTQGMPPYSAAETDTVAYLSWASLWLTSGYELLKIFIHPKPSSLIAFKSMENLVFENNNLSAGKEKNFYENRFIAVFINAHAWIYLAAFSPIRFPTAVYLKYSLILYSHVRLGSQQTFFQAIWTKFLCLRFCEFMQDVRIILFKPIT
jgi:hypothetical protein